MKLLFRFLISALSLLIASKLCTFLGFQFYVHSYSAAIGLAILIAVLDHLLEKLTNIEASPKGKGFKGFLLAAVILKLSSFILSGVRISMPGALLGAFMIGLVDSFMPGSRKNFE